MRNRIVRVPKSRMNRAVPRPSWLIVVMPEAACHAGGRGFESRRSRKTPCKSACGVVGSDARFGLTTQTFLEATQKTAKIGPKPVSEVLISSQERLSSDGHGRRATRRNGRRSQRGCRAQAPVLAGAWRSAARTSETWAAATGGEAASVALCHELGLDYVSCSPYRVPLARLEAAQAALKESGAAAYTAAGG